MNTYKKKDIGYTKLGSLEAEKQSAYLPYTKAFITI